MRRPGVGENAHTRACDAGLGPIKINAVIERGLNDHTAIDLIEHFRGTGVIVRFIEYMDVGNRNHWNLDRVVPSPYPAPERPPGERAKGKADSRGRDP